MTRRLMLAVLASARLTMSAGAQTPDPTTREFTIDNFKLESGSTLPKAVVAYGTYGKLNSAGTNAILLPSHYMANHHGYDWLIGKGGALDTTKSFLVMTELFGNRHSSFPSNNPEPL